MLIDADAMLGRYPRRHVGEGTVAETLDRMDRFGIAEAVVSHTLSWLHDPHTGNLRLLDLVVGEPRLRPCWVLLPDTCGETGSAAAFTAAALEAGVGAVRAYPADHGYDLAGPRRRLDAPRPRRGAAAAAARRGAGRLAVHRGDRADPPRAARRGRRARFTACSGRRRACWPAPPTSTWGWPTSPPTAASSGSSSATARTAWSSAPARRSGTRPSR
ncbi:hypothetical protein [Nonomuraea dietziae]|uniref:hypothetical protein n=1 Tax=Nonomuraea dietziae TaxID=65515 RepID=UPI0031E0440B